MAIDVKMGVSGIAQFRQAMGQAQQSVKTLDAELKLNEKQLKASGDKETYMQQKSKLLQQQIAAMNRVVKEGQNALTAMTKNGVDPSSKAYQQMQQRVLEAQSALLDMEGELFAVGQTAQQTATQTDQLTNSLNGINKKVSFDAVLNGIGKITGGMEEAARKVAALATDVWDTMAMAASWADNENTLAAMYGIDVETLQRMQGASSTIDTTVEAIIKSRQKLKQAMASDSKDIAEAFGLLGVKTGEVSGKYSDVREFRAWEDVFWDTGEALLNYRNEVERDVLAQRLFGRSWMELMPLFRAGREEYQKTMDDQSIVTQQNVDKLNALDDALQKLDQDYQATKKTILSELAPAFTTVADTVSGLIREFNKYLQTDEGQEKLKAMGQAVTDLFTGLSDVDFGAAVDTAASVLETITGALEWIRANHTQVENAVKCIGTAFLTLKAAQIIGSLVQSAAALKTLLGSSAAGAAASSAASAAWAGVDGVEVADLPNWLQYASYAALGKTAADVNARVWRDQKENAEEMLAKMQAMNAGQAAQLPARSRAVSGTAAEESMRGAAELAEEREKAIYRSLYQALNDYDMLEPYSPGPEEFWGKTLKPLVMDAAAAGGAAEAGAEEIAQMWHQKFLESLFDDEWEGSTQGLLNILQEAIDEQAQGITVKPSPQLPEDAETLLQEQLNSVELHVSVIPSLQTDGVDAVSGGFANGLPFVPFDGYIAALHKGERIVPANQNKSYTANSNLYVESMYMNNGTDAQGLAAAMAAENRRIRAGFGS